MLRLNIRYQKMRYKNQRVKNAGLEMQDRMIWAEHARPEYHLTPDCRTRNVGLENEGPNLILAVIRLVNTRYKKNTSCMYSEQLSAQ